MKKFLTLICLLVCVFSFTACGSETQLSDLEQQKLEMAKSKATDSVISTVKMFLTDEYKDVLNGYTADEVEYVIGQSLGLNADGNAFLNAIASFKSAAEKTGEFTVGDATAEIDNDQIIVYVDIDGEKKDAQAEIIFTNDLFLKLESAALNPKESFGALMKKAGMNTLIGMGTVFIVLIVISWIIGLFKYIPAIQKKFEKKAAPVIDEPRGNDGIENAMNQITELEEVADEADNSEEISAVIAAAIAAYESELANTEQIPADGFVVRSIKKVGRRAVR